MELDDFKAHWNTIQQKEFKQEYTTEKLKQIVMNATNTLNVINQKNAYWSKLGKAICSALIAVLLLILVLNYFMPDKNMAPFGKAVIYVTIMIIYSLVTMWAYKRQQNIFTRYNGDNLKETLAKIITEFKRFYVLLNIIYLFLYPAYFYAFFKLFFSFWALSIPVLLAICGGLTVVCLIASHIYYKIKYFRKIKSLEEDLAELEGA